MTQQTGDSQSHDHPPDQSTDRDNPATGSSHQQESDDPTPTFASLVTGYADDAVQIFQDESLLDTDTVVSQDRIVGREEQMTQVSDRLRKATAGDCPPDLLLYGPSGTGKTLITKGTCDAVKRIASQNGYTFGYTIINGKKLGTISATVYQLCESVASQAGVACDVPAQGIATKYKWDWFFTTVQEHFDVFTLVIDEMDLLTGSQATSEPTYSEILYQMTRDSLPETELSLVAISNDTEVLQGLDSRVQSSYYPAQINFSDYNADEIRRILNNRRDAFMDDVLASDVIPKIAAQESQKDGDARGAIKLLRFSAEKAIERGETNVTANHVDLGQEKLETNRILAVAGNMAPRKQMALFAVSLMLAVSPETSIRSGTAYQLFSRLMDSTNGDDLTQETFGNYIKKLQTYSILNYMVKGNGYGQGIKGVIELNEDPESVLSTLKDHVFTASRADDIDDLKKWKQVARAMTTTTPQ